MPKNIKKIVKDKYSNIASTSSGCGCRCGEEKDDSKIATSIGYSEEDLRLAGNANLGLGCGNPVALSNIKKGDTVVDLGSGAGIDCLLARQKVGSHGKVIGIDMTEEMVNKSNAIAKEKGYKNIEYILSEIDKIPLEENSVNIIISNCVINLTPDKKKAFDEAYRILKKGGRMFVSDIVLLEELTPEQRNDEKLIAGCVGGALLKEKYLNAIKQAGFKIKILHENKDISKEQYHGINLESLMVKAIK